MSTASWSTRSRSSGTPAAINVRLLNADGTHTWSTSHDAGATQSSGMLSVSYIDRPACTIKAVMDAGGHGQRQSLQRQSVIALVMIQAAIPEAVIYGGSYAASLTIRPTYLQDLLYIGSPEARKDMLHIDWRHLWRQRCPDSTYLCTGSPVHR